MKIVVPFIAVSLLAALAYFGVANAKLNFLFGVVIPYVAFTTFILGFAYRIWDWVKTPVPFNITTTAGQQKTLPWIKRNPLENPSNSLEVLGRTLLEVFAFRSLFRNTEAKNIGGNLVYESNKFLWFFGMIFHWGFFLVFVRHIRFFVEKIPAAIIPLEQMDSILQVGVPAFYMTDLLLLGGVTFLFLRRIVNPQMRYLSLAADFFPLFIIMALAVSGMLMRYMLRVDVIGIKNMMLGLVSFAPVAGDVHPVFYMHLFLVSVLFMYFPFSKLMHMGGIFLSPTKNMANDSRVKRHESPWQYDVQAYPYSEYEDAYRDKMKEAGLPVDKE
ncbi:MAG: sulfate reduction electron transfer complex DsrMKJOP subunit DsrM [Spirochaetia bacterium]|nr:sulfate reduction electron transfer complex DsrMKJOP subunit DsrM [Spirochaetia bacterium]